MKSRTAQEVLGLRFDRLPVASHAALVLALGALWLLGRRYGGVIHDASIYVLQGMRVLEPASFARDLFFLHGAQDAFTLFPQVYALLIGAFGAGNAARVVTVTGQIAFFAAAGALVFRIATGQARWWSMALLAVVSGYYGGVGVFRLAEPFATARTLSEPLVLAALDHACLSPPYRGGCARCRAGAASTGCGAGHCLDISLARRGAPENALVDSAARGTGAGRRHPLAGIHAQV